MKRTPGQDIDDNIRATACGRQYVVAGSTHTHSVRPRASWPGSVNTARVRMRGSCRTQEVKSVAKKSCVTL
eukprot:7146541-Pyramimonas_sp.AAC.1